MLNTISVFIIIIISSLHELINGSQINEIQAD